MLRRLLGGPSRQPAYQVKISLPKREFPFARTASFDSLAPVIRLHLSLLLVTASLVFSSCGTKPLPSDEVRRPEVFTPPVVDPAPAEPATSYNRLSSPTRAVPRPPVGPPAVAAQRVIVLDALTGRPLYTKNADQRCAVASTQKLLTALTVMKSGSVSDPVTITSSDTRVEPSKLYLKPGETYTRRDLLKALIVKSGNDVAKALARDVGGSEASFMSMMNAHGRSIGMTNSNFVNPHGLTEPGQYSTARDIGLCALVAYRQPLLRSYMATTSYTFRRPSGATKPLKNTNRLLRNETWVTGMKTGTTNLSGRCLVSAGQHNGAHVIVVVLKSTSSSVWNDSEKLLNWALQR